MRLLLAAVSKNNVLKFLLVQILVIVEAITSNDNTINIALVRRAYLNKASLYNLIPKVLIFNIMMMKFIVPNKLLIPIRSAEKIAKSTFCLS